MICNKELILQLNNAIYDASQVHSWEASFYIWSISTILITFFLYRLNLLVYRTAPPQKCVMLVATHAGASRCCAMK